MMNDELKKGNRIKAQTLHKQNSILLLAVVICLVFIFQSGKTFGQLATEKDILLTEYPVYYDILQNGLVEAQISDRFIAKNKVKVLTESLRYKTKMIDTVLPLQRLFYDKSGRLEKRELFYFGQLFRTWYFSYSGNEVIVYDESRDNQYQKMLLYKILSDSFGNPVKYSRYQDYNLGNGLDVDSVTYRYTYNKKGNILIKKQHFFNRDEDESRYSDLIFKYQYNNLGQEKSYTVSNGRKQIYSAEKEYQNGLLTKKNATYNFYDLPNHYFDSTEYFYGKDLKLRLIKRTYHHDPLMSQPDEIIIQLVYDKNGFLSEKYPLVFKEDNHLFYEWEFYD